METHQRNPLKSIQLQPASKFRRNFTKLPLAGSSAAIAETVTFPLDLTKTRLQIQGEALAVGGGGGVRAGHRKGMFHMAWSIIREEGVPKLWRGVTPAIIRHLFYTSLRVSCYEYLREKVMKRDAHGHFPLYKSILASLASGVFGQFFTSPMDLVKVRFQMDGRRQLQGFAPRYKGVSDALATIVREEGVFKLWRGVVPSCQRAAFVALGDLATYDIAKRNIIKRTQLKDSMPTHVLSSGLAGLSATTLGELAVHTVLIIIIIIIIVLIVYLSVYRHTS